MTNEFSLDKELHVFGDTISTNDNIPNKLLEINEENVLHVGIQNTSTNTH